jgi:hypothetical protein
MFMDLCLKYPQWQEPLAAAIIEIDRQQLIEKLQQAEVTMIHRMQELGCGETDENELRALYDGLSLIRGIRQEDCSSAGQADNS